jgi:hypothetical protein
MTTRHESKCSRLFLDRIRVASPQWENGLRQQNLLVTAYHILYYEAIRCDIILNVRAPTEDKRDDTKDSFYEELEHVFDQFPKNHIKLL